eukprot:gene40960-54238_t
MATYSGAALADYLAGLPDYECTYGLFSLDAQQAAVIYSAANMGAAFLHGAAVTIHKAQGSQWEDVQVFAPDLWAAAQAGRSEAGLPLWKRLAYVAITRAEKRLHWVVRNRLALPKSPLVVADLVVRPAPLTLEGLEPEESLS